MRFHSYVVFLTSWTFVLFCFLIGGSLVYCPCSRVVPPMRFSNEIELLKKINVAVAVSILHSNLILLFYF